ncbi:hypothetical protein [Deinococcus budaensis]|uniref:Uncharacterized protein n=1 Tax=Deinococcus budaensis TaxID=1665626 RepID=A0A7W8GI40_9DEIO|nr:hypothetical protein [Deinococcus budaensis]MBB5235703.1 hypothetical protein [Deinococcus budaensis]
MKRLCLCFCIVLTGCADDRVEARWRPPPGVLPGLELVGIDRWGGDGINAGVAEQFLELRCTQHPSWRIRKAYWPGPEWRGTVTWDAEGVTYQPPEDWKVGGKPLAVLSITVADVRWHSSCPSPGKP